VVDVSGKAVLTMEDLAPKVMKDLLTNTFATEFNWLGTNGKTSFEASNLRKTVDREYKLLILNKMFIWFFYFFLNEQLFRQSKFLFEVNEW